mmetsp:Transcript_116634/g.341386  ORF Transcript_116634/g.341386 Transcript_116634/m.341386 type:complete len:253 (-) Transcript_116634:952-1710(-)
MRPPRLGTSVASSLPIAASSLSETTSSVATADFSWSRTSVQTVSSSGRLARQARCRPSRSCSTMSAKSEGCAKGGRSLEPPALQALVARSSSVALAARRSCAFGSSAAPPPRGERVLVFDRLLDRERPPLLSASETKPSLHFSSMEVRSVPHVILLLSSEPLRGLPCSAAPWFFTPSWLSSTRFPRLRPVSLASLVSSKAACLERCAVRTVPGRISSRSRLLKSCWISFAGRSLASSPKGFSSSVAMELRLQ